jgi:hypothetical protein
MNGLTESDKKVLKSAKEYLLGNYEFAEINDQVVHWVLAREIGASTKEPARRIYLWDVLPKVLKKWLKALVTKKRKQEQMRDALAHEQFHASRTD